MPANLHATADQLEAIRDTLADLADAAGRLLSGPALATFREAARPWRACLDRAVGAEPTTTIDDTIAALRLAAGERPPAVPANLNETA